MKELFNDIGEDQLYSITGGCGFCVAGTISGAAMTGIGIGTLAGAPGVVAGGIIGTIAGIAIAIR